MESKLNKVPEYLIEALRLRGIVPGAICTSALYPRDPQFIVPPISQWEASRTYVVTGIMHDSGRNCFLMDEDADGTAYAQVIVPSTSKYMNP
jgi:hypothetical protein